MKWGEYYSWKRRHKPKIEGATSNEIVSGYSEKTQ